VLDEVELGIKRTFLVTGGHGFLGQHLVKQALIDPRLKPVILDSVSALAPEGVEVIRADVRDLAQLRKIFRDLKPDFLVHAAAQLPRAEPEAIRATTVDGTRNILLLADELEIERTIFVSSTAVYSQKGDGVHQEEEELAEGFGTYGRAKVVAERLCAEARSRGQCVSVVRPKSFLGPGRMGVFQILFDWILEGRRIPTIGDGSNRFQLLDVDDLCQAILVLLWADKASANQAFNVGASEYDSVKSEIGNLCEYAGTGSRSFSIPVAPTHALLSILYKVGLSPIYPWVFRTAATNSEVSVSRMASLGWSPKYSNTETLRRAFDWYRENRSNFEGVGDHTGHRAIWSQGALKLLKHLF